MEPLIDEKLRQRFAHASRNTPNEEHVDPTVVAKFTKGSISYYAVAYDELRNMICCYISGNDDSRDLHWVSVEKLERKPLFGKACVRDKYFTEVTRSHIRIDEPREFSDELPKEKDAEALAASTEELLKPEGEFKHEEPEQEDELDMSR